MRGLAGRGLGRGLRGVGVVATQYLGISAATLRSDLRSGQSLAEIANNTPGTSAAGLKAALSSAATTRLTDERSAGTITSAQEARRLSELSSRLDALLQRTGLRAHRWAATGSSGPTGSSLFGS